MCVFQFLTTLLDIIQTNCPIFDVNLFLWWQFPTGVSEETMRKKQLEDELEKLMPLQGLPSSACK